jgi:hypothetical protein
MEDLSCTHLDSSLNNYYKLINMKNVILRDQNIIKRIFIIIIIIFGFTLYFTIRRSAERF